MAASGSSKTDFAPSKFKQVEWKKPKSIADSTPLPEIFL